MLNKWKLKVVLSTKFSRSNKYYNFFFGWSVSIKFGCWGIVEKKNEKETFIADFLYIWYIYIYIYIYTYIYLFILYIYCMYMSVNVEMELPMWQGKRHVFSCSALNSVLLLLYQSASPNTSTPKIDFSLNPVFSYAV